MEPALSSVEIEVVDDGGDTVYVKSEQSAGYCLFGGGEPECATVDVDVRRTMAGDQPNHRRPGIHGLFHRDPRGLVDCLWRVATEFRSAQVRIRQ